MCIRDRLDPVFEEKVIGHAEIRQIFKASGVGNIAGSYVLDGFMAVSYTHLDVYKRQESFRCSGSGESTKG